MINNEKIAVIIPCYKVSKHIKNVVLSIPKFVDNIIIIDDKCPENSGDISSELNSEKLIILYHDKNKGVGAATITGYKKAKEIGCNILVKVDGDEQMDTSKIHELIEPILTKRAGYTKGNRFHDFKALKKMPKTRLLGNSFLSFFVKGASGYWNIMDPTNGFTAISSQTISQIDINALDKRYFFEIDILILLNISNIKIVDLPISAIYNNETSNLSVRHSILTFPFKIVKGLFYRLFFKYYIYNFNMASIYLLLGIPLVMFGVLFGIYRWSMAIIYNVENTAGTIMLVALPIILGVQFLLQAIQIDIRDSYDK